MQLQKSILNHTEGRNRSIIDQLFIDKERPDYSDKKLNNPEVKKIRNSTNSLENKIVCASLPGPSKMLPNIKIKSKLSHHPKTELGTIEKSERNSSKQREMNRKKMQEIFLTDDSRKSDSFFPNLDKPKRQRYIHQSSITSSRQSLTNLALSIDTPVSQ